MTAEDEIFEEDIPATLIGVFYMNADGDLVADRPTEEVELIVDEEVAANSASEKPDDFYDPEGIVEAFDPKDPAHQEAKTRFQKQKP